MCSPPLAESVEASPADPSTRSDSVTLDGLLNCRSARNLQFSYVTALVLRYDYALRDHKLPMISYVCDLTKDMFDECE
jgi:hypothetical protein